MTRPDIYPVSLVSARLRLREFQPDDLDATMSVVGDPEVTDFLSFDVKTRDEQRELLAAQRERVLHRPRTEYYLAVELLPDAGLVGFARLGLGAHSAAKLGYAFRRSVWGKGLATEAAGAIVDFGFNTLGLHRITAACGPDNVGSVRVLEKLAFSYEGRLRDHVFTNGGWRDSLLYSRLATSPE